MSLETKIPVVGVEENRLFVSSLSMADNKKAEELNVLRRIKPFQFLKSVAISTTGTATATAVTAATAPRGTLLAWLCDIDG
jgi:hypothetical protein